MTPPKGQRGRKPGVPEAPDGAAPSPGQGAATPTGDRTAPVQGGRAQPDAAAGPAVPQPAEVSPGAAKLMTAPQPPAEASTPSLTPLPDASEAPAMSAATSPAAGVRAGSASPETAVAPASEAPGVPAATSAAAAARAAAPSPDPAGASAQPSTPASDAPGVSAAASPAAAARAATPSPDPAGASAPTPAAPDATVAPPSLAHLPLPLFAVPMGLGGLGLLWRDAAFLVGPLAWFGEAILLAATLAWGWIGWLHLRRARAHPEALLADLADPVRLPFLGAPTIGLLLIAGFLGGYSTTLGGTVWVVALSVHLAVGAWLFGRILSGEATPALVAPPLLIPMVGNILAPAIGGGFGYAGLSAVAFGIGAFLWLMVLPLLVQRFLAGPALPPRMAPSVVILLAPPSVAAVSLPTLTGEAGLATLALFGIALFTALALLAAVPRIAAAPFSAAFWGLSFPTAAFGIALSRQVQAAPGLPGSLLFAIVLAAVTALIGWLAWRTLAAARAGAFLRPH
jgi:tellurite resistance protein